VHVAFVDDTKQKGLRQGMGQLMSLGAVVFPEDGLIAYAKSVEAIYAKTGAPDGAELKWSNPRGSWFRDDGARHLTGVRTACVAAALDAGASAVVVIWDLGRTSLQGDDAGERILAFLYERLAMLLSRPEASQFMLVCDKPSGGPKDEDAWIGRTLEITKYGTKYVRPGQVALPVLTAPSHYHPQLQLADLIAGCTTAAIAGVKAGLDLMPHLKPLLHTNFHGLVGGAGVKLFPDELNNLHYWALQEASYSRPATNVGVSLPWRKWEYADNDGLPATA